MGGYNSVERQIARALESVPFIRKGIAYAYHRVNYVLHREGNFTFSLRDDVRLTHIAEWSGIRRVDRPLFFGYYDRSPFSSDGQRGIFHSPDRDHVDLLLFDRERQAMKKVGRSQTWNWQQGALTQWLPGCPELIMFNDLVDGKLGARIVDTSAHEHATIGWPMQAVRPGGREYLSINYRRLMWLRPDYGYTQEVSNFAVRQSDSEDGVWKVDVNSGAASLLFSLEDLRKIQPHPSMKGANHKVNHFMYSPNGDRFVFMHRWIGSSGKWSRLFVARADGSDLRLLLDDRMVSHYSWRDDDKIVAYARVHDKGDRYYMFNAEGGVPEIIGGGLLERYGDGHPNFSPSGRFLITDTYADRRRQRTLILFDTESNRLFELGRFFSPWQYNGVRRCDLHPRWMKGGRQLCIDSVHDGRRGSYVLDIGPLLDSL